MDVVRLKFNSRVEMKAQDGLLATKEVGVLINTPPGISRNGYFALRGVYYALALIPIGKMHLICLLSMLAMLPPSLAPAT